MSTDSDTRPLRFLDAFFQERNIKWILLVGMAILLGSSLMLVTSNWDSYAPVWKYGVLLAYTAAIHLLGPVCYTHLGLRRTGTGLMALTVLLLPVLFVAWHWVAWSAAGGATNTIIRLALLGATTMFAVMASQRIFGHFLCGSQPTFVASYLLLCLAGAVLPSLGPSGWPAITTAALSWAVFTLGTIKVNRHVFWLTEEHRHPRIFGFFPIALLGTQFLTLFALNAARGVGWDWIGLACVLIAVPVLCAADAVARVFQQRTGDLVRPLPVAIIAPLGVGLLLVVTGIALATSGMVPPGKPYALVPTAGLGAAMMVVVARRTSHRAFVWAMLVFATVAYNFSPVFFLDLARAVLAVGAEAVNEERLPYAFYGLTYLPLLAVFGGLSEWLKRRERPLFAEPMRAFVIGISCVLLALAFNHTKAIFPVGAAITALAGTLAAVSRDRRLVVVALLSYVAATIGSGSFAEHVLEWNVSASTPATAALVAATVLLVASRFVDDWLPVGQAGITNLPMTRLVSLLMTLATGLYVLLADEFFSCQPVFTFTSFLLIALLSAQALVWGQRWLGVVTVLFVWTRFGFVTQVVGYGFEDELLTSLLLGQWTCGVLLSRFSYRLARVFAKPMECTAMIALLPWYALHLFGLVDRLSYPGSSGAWYLWCGLMSAWAFAATYRYANQFLGAAAYVGLLMYVTAALYQLPVADYHEFIPAVVAAASGIGVIVAQRLRIANDFRGFTNHQHLRAIHSPVETISVILLIVTLLGSFFIISINVWTAGLFALAGLVARQAFEFSQSPPFSIRRLDRGLAAAAGTWFLLVATLTAGDGEFTIFDWSTAIALPVALAAASSLVTNTLVKPSDSMIGAFVRFVHRFAMGAMLAVAMLSSLQKSSLTVIEVILAGSVFALMAGRHLTLAARQQNVPRVWVAQVIIGLGVLYMIFFEVITFGRGISMFVVLAAAAVMHVVSVLSEQHGRWAIVSAPFRQTAFVLPMVAVVIGIGRELIGHPAWLGMSSLAMLLAAAFYFWRGLELGEKRLLVLATLIVNAALGLLWHELSWTDPQFYMIPIGATVLGLVQLLRAEIPAHLHNPLRYLGASLILVSPVFHIVDGSWLHMFSLMVSSVIVILLSMGLRQRPLLYAGATFLAADLVAMLVCGTIDHPNLLWFVGLALGAAILTLGAVCENHREALLQRMRLMSATLDEWE